MAHFLAHPSWRRFRRDHACGKKVDKLKRNKRATENIFSIQTKKHTQEVQREKSLYNLQKKKKISKQLAKTTEND